MRKIATLPAMPFASISESIAWGVRTAQDQLQKAHHSGTTPPGSLPDDLREDFLEAFEWTRRYASERDDMLDAAIDAYSNTITLFAQWAPPTT